MKPLSYRYTNESFSLIIAPGDAGTFQLVINGTAAHLYVSPEEAAAAVAGCATGNPIWDAQRSVVAPAELADWVEVMLEH